MSATAIGPLTSNWDLNRLPTSSDSAYDANNLTGYITKPGAATYLLYVGDSTGAGTVKMTGGTLTTSWQYVGNQQKTVDSGPFGANLSFPLHIPFFVPKIHRQLLAVLGNGKVQHDRLSCSCFW